MKARLHHSVVGSLLLCAGVLSACSHGAKPGGSVAPASSDGASAPVASAPVAASTQMASSAALVTPRTVMLKPSKRVYVARLFSEGQAHRLGWRTLELTDATYGGAPAWLLAETRVINTVTLAESLYVSKATLEPVHRVVYTADEAITTHYTADSVVTTFAGDSGGGVRVALANEPNLVGNIYWLEPLFASLPLAAGWKGTATTLFVGPHDHARVAMQMSVVGEDSVLAPDGKFDCWMMTLQVGETEEHLWVRKSDHLLIKEDTPVAGIAAAKVELLLAGGQTPKVRPGGQ